MMGDGRTSDHRPADQTVNKRTGSEDQALDRDLGGGGWMAMEVGLEGRTSRTRMDVREARVA